MTKTSNSFPAPIRTIEGVTEYKLSNGLTVILLPDQTTQNVTVCITYLIGSRHEGLGEAGMAHLLEHMLFKGTPSQPNITAALQDRGAFYNASTWYDRTSYFETLSATDDNLEFALKLEADRMINSRIRQEDLDTEMTVVRNEFEMGENDPSQILHDQMFSLAYRWHNYGKSTIGNRSDIERVPIKNLRVFYERYYQPDNAVLLVAGHFDITQTQDLILRYFGQLPKPSRILDNTYTEEPAQDGIREVTLLRAGDMAHAAVAYHIPAASHPDFPALLVLSEILSSEPSGLLFQSLVQSGLSSHVDTSAFALKEPGMFLVSTTTPRHDQAAHVLGIMINQLEHLSEAEITSENVERAKARILKHIQMVIMNSTELALELTESIAQGDYRLFFYTRDQVKTITVDDVIRVAVSYFIESNRTTGLFIPVDEPTRAIIAPTPDVECLLEGYSGSEDIQMGEKFEATTENIDAHTLRSVLGGTIRTAILSKFTRGHANQARLTFRFGSEQTLQGRNAILELIPDLLRRGTKTMSLQQVQDKLDTLHSTLKIYAAHPGVVMVDITSHRDYLKDVIYLVSDLMRTPRFSEDEFAIVHQREVSNIMSIRTDPTQIAMHELDRLRNPFSSDSIHYVPTLDETIAELNTLTLDQCQQVYTDLYGANHLEVSVVGDCDPSINSVIESCFNNWRSPVNYQLITKPAVNALGELRSIYTPDKQMAVVAMGTNFPMRDDDLHYPAMRMANFIFGESMQSRLMQRLREKEGLSYEAGSSLDINRHDFSAGITLYAMCATDKVDFTLNAMQEEYYRWIDKGVTEKELQECKQSFMQYFRNVLANDGIVLQTLASMIDVNRTFGYYTQMLQKMDQLQTEDIKKVLEIFLRDKPVAIVKVGDFKGVIA